MARKPRDTIVYRVKKGRETVGIGTTNDPPRRESQRRGAGQKFDKLVPVTPKLTQESALKFEQQMLRTFMGNHGGKLPKYNKDPTG